MALETITLKSKVCITLDPNSGANVVPLFEYTPYSKSGYRLIDEYMEVKNLKLTSWIYSIPKTQIPLFELEDTESKQQLTEANLNWKSPRIQLDLLIDLNGSLNWQRISTHSLLNLEPYPYREFELGNHNLNSKNMIAVQIKDVGFGGLNGSDKVAVFADLERYAVIERTTDTGIKIANNITTTASTIVNSNANRKGLTLFNNSDKDVFVDVVNTVSSTSHLVRLKPSYYWEAPSPIYTGAYWAIVEAGFTAIDIREFQ